MQTFILRWSSEHHKYSLAGARPTDTLDTKRYFTQERHVTKRTSFMYKAHKLSIIHYS
jgi:hypothetical protein